MSTGNNWVELSVEALAHNLRALQAAVGGGTELLAVVKADAYGHGAERCAPVLVAAGARWLGVTCAAEGVRVRRALAGAAVENPHLEILAMSGPLPEDAASLREHRLTAVIWTTEQAGWLEQGTAVHVEIDTGMSRQGARPDGELAAVLAAVQERGLRLDGVFTHFSSSEMAASEVTQEQQRLFEQAVAQVHAAGARPAWVHAGASSAVDNPAQSWPWLERLADGVGARAMVRPGLALYGFCLPIDGRAEPQVQRALRPVLQWKARVLAMRELRAGDPVGYNGTFVAPGPMRVALLPVGYADGLRRELSSTNARPGGWVVLHGRHAPILGRVSMNLTVVDVSAIPQAAALDVATLLGPGVSAEDHARLAGTIAYEILCGIHPCT